MSHILKIRHAELSESTDLAALGFVAWEQGIMPLYRDKDRPRDQLMNQLCDYCSNHIESLVVAEMGGELVGWASRLRNKAYIPYIFVTPHLQGQGIGGLLLRRMESIFELEGHTTVQLETPADHVQAVKFYETQGYNILAMKANAETGRVSRQSFISVRLEKRLRPFDGPIDDAE